MVKTALNISFLIGKEIKYSEMITLLARITFSIYSSPLALASVSSSIHQEDELMPLTPNQLLLGHNTDEVPAMEFSDSDMF